MDASEFRASTGPKGRKRQPARGSASYIRKRAVTACQVCRARRTKCDNKKPSCSFCEKIGAKCITQPTNYSSFDPASIKILEKLEHIETLLELPNNDEAQDSPSPSTSIRTPERHSVPSNPSSIPKSPNYNAVQNECSLQILASNVLNWPVFGGKFVSQARSLALIQRSESKPPTTTGLIESCINNATVGNELLDNFIQHVHIKNPILDITELRRLVQRLGLNGVSWDLESCLVLLVWAIGAISKPFKDPAPHKSHNLNLASELFAAASKRLGAALSESTPLSAQCFFYAGVYLMSTFQPLTAWRHFLQALACCQEFEFAIEAARALQIGSEATGVTASPTEQRLYWTCWKSEVELRMCLGLFDFKTQDRVYPIHFPSPPSIPALDDRAWFFYLAEISLRRLNTTARNDIGRILASNTMTTEEIDMKLLKMVSFYEQQLTAWRHSLPETISLDSAVEDDDVLKFVLRCHQVDFVELITWPFVYEVITRPVRFHLKLTFAKKGIEACVERTRVSSVGYRHYHHGTWMLLQSCARSAIVLFAASLSDSAHCLLPADWTSSVTQVKNFLQYWSNEHAGLQKHIQVLDELQTTSHLASIFS